MFQAQFYGLPYLIEEATYKHLQYRLRNDLSRPIDDPTLNRRSNTNSLSLIQSEITR